MAAPDNVLITSSKLTGAPASFVVHGRPVGEPPGRQVADVEASSPGARRCWSRRCSCRASSSSRSLDLAPGDPLATLSGGRTLPPEAVAQLRAQYHLDDPFLVRYVALARQRRLPRRPRDVDRLPRERDLGDRRADRRDDRPRALRRAADHRLRRRPRRRCRACKKGCAGQRRSSSRRAIFAAVPSFVAAIVLLSVFSRQPGVVPGARARATAASTRIKHLTLPAIALALSAMAIVVRVTRVAVRTEMGREHVQTAVSRGIPYPQVVRKHVLRNASIPVTTVVGITITSLIALSRGRRARVQPRRPRRRAGAGGAVEGLRRRPGDLADLRGGVRGRQRGRRPAVRLHGSARGDREPGDMSTSTPAVLVQARARRAAGAWPRNQIVLWVCSGDRRHRRVPGDLRPAAGAARPQRVEPRPTRSSARSPGHPLGFDCQGRDLLQPPADRRADLDGRAVPGRRGLDGRRARRWRSPPRGSAAGSTRRSRPSSTSCSRSRRSCWPSWPRPSSAPGSPRRRWRWPRLHAVHRPRPARRGAAGAGARVHRRLRGPGPRRRSRSARATWPRTCCR